MKCRQNECYLTVYECSRKLAQYAAHMDHQAYMEARQYNEENQRQSPTPSSSAGQVAAAAYQHHIQQYQNKHRLRLQRHQQKQQNNSHDSNSNEEILPDDMQNDSEWINSNLEVNVAECESQNPLQSDDEDAETENKESHAAIKHEQTEEKSPTPPAAAAASSETAQKSEVKRERTPEQLKKKAAAAARRQSQDRSEETDKDDEAKEKRETGSVPQPVEDIESVQHVLEHQRAHLSSESPSPPSTSSAHKHASSSSASLHAHGHYGKYSSSSAANAAEGGYLLNEHGMLMTHDYIHAPGIAGSSNGHHSMQDADYGDIKMDDYDAAEMRLTSEEMSQWKDVIKMDDYLAKGRRPQFWEEPFTRRVKFIFIFFVLVIILNLTTGTRCHQEQKT